MGWNSDDARSADVIELFDLAHDPYEKTDLAAQQPEKVKELRPDMTSWLGRPRTPRSHRQPPVSTRPKSGAKRTDIPAPNKCWLGDAPGLLRPASMDAKMPRDDPAAASVNPSGNSMHGTPLAVSEACCLTLTCEQGDIHEIAVVWDEYCIGAGAGVVRRTAENAVTPNPAEVGNKQVWRLVNAEAEFVEEGGKRFIRLKAKGGDEVNSSNAGIALVEGLEFKQGTIELDLKGRNERQRSFLGVTFHALDNKTAEIVYFRPFNFQADPPFETRAVQYVSWPEHTWQKLRDQKPGVFENAVQPVPDPTAGSTRRLK